MKRKPNVSRLMPSRYSTNERAQNTAWCREMLQTADSARKMNSDSWPYMRAQIVPFGRTCT
jgi:hypothetical protein